MNWDAFGAVAEAVGTLAVLITLIYLAIQLKIANKQREIESLRHNWDGLNSVCEWFGQSAETASIIRRGRESLGDLSDDEQLVFEFMHIRALNTIEAWYLQLMETSPPGEYRDQQLDNIKGVIAFLFEYKGAFETWRMIKHTFVPIHDLFDQALSDFESA